MNEQNNINEQNYFTLDLYNDLLQKYVYFKVLHNFVYGIKHLLSNKIQNLKFKMYLNQLFIMSMGSRVNTIHFVLNIFFQPLEIFLKTSMSRFPIMVPFIYLLKIQLI